jgi:CheY-like chemotaxis protein
MAINKKILSFVKAGSVSVIFAILNSAINEEILYAIVKAVKNKDNQDNSSCLNSHVSFAISFVSTLFLCGAFYLVYKIIINKNSETLTVTPKPSLAVPPPSPKSIYIKISSKLRNPLQEILFAMQKLSIDSAPTELNLESAKFTVTHAVEQLEILANELLELSKEEADVQLTRFLSGSGYVGVIGKKLHILVVDDSAANRAFLQSILVKLEHTVVTANNGQEAVDLVNSSAIKIFDIIFMDINMPVMDGLEATRCIRAKFSNNILPIIACTSNGSDEDLRNFDAVKINGHVLKPINLFKINTVLQNIFIKNTPQPSSSSDHGLIHRQSILHQYTNLIQESNSSTMHASHSSEIDVDKETPSLNTPTHKTILPRCLRNP